MHKIKILQLITDLSIGGAEKVLLDLCTNVDRDIFENHVIGLNDEIDLKQDFAKNKIKVENLEISKNPINFFKNLLYLHKYIKKNSIKIIHVHMFHPLIFSSVLKILNPNIKVVFTSHNINIGSKLREVITFMLKPFRDVDIVFSKSMITNIYKKNTKIIPNGVDISLYCEKIAKNDKFTFISIGILREQKNQLFLPSTAAYLIEHGVKDFEIQIVGGVDASGDMRKEIQEEIVKHGVENEVKMLGARFDVSTLLKKAHCFVMPSLYEGLPIALLEAGASGIAIITTPVGAIDSVIDDECGYLSCLDTFAKTMLEVITNQAVANQKAQKAQKKIESDFSIEKMVNSHEEIYKKLLPIESSII